MRLPIVVLSFALVAGCGSSAVTPPPLTITASAPESKTDGTYKLDLGPLDDEPVCSKIPGIKEKPEMCVAGLRTALQETLTTVLDRQFTGKGEIHSARFRFARFSHTRKEKRGIEVAFQWRFTLLNSQGDPLLMLDERTIGPELIRPGVDDEEAIEAALNLVVDTIAETLARGAGGAVAEEDERTPEPGELVEPGEGS